MRSDANRIGFRAIRSILEGAHPFEIEVAGKIVNCAPSRVAVAAWPEGGLDGLDPAIDRDWPNPVDVTCSWEGGSCVLRVACTLGGRRVVDTTIRSDCTFGWGRERI
jgi:hypothetical protein